MQLVEDLLPLPHGAGDEARTRYLHLGKVALYRMSYARASESLYSIAYLYQIEAML